MTDPLMRIHVDTDEETTVVLSDHALTLDSDESLPMSQSYLTMVQWWRRDKVTPNPRSPPAHTTIHEFEGGLCPFDRSDPSLHRYARCLTCVVLMCRSNAKGCAARILIDKEQYQDPFILRQLSRWESHFSEAEGDRKLYKLKQLEPGKLTKCYEAMVP